MDCPKCGFGNPDSFNFCGECAHPLMEKVEASSVNAPTESERKHVTIMFSDLSGYTAMTEKLDPEEVKEIISQIFEDITKIIHKYGGFIERFIGDAVMAIFGIPKAHEDDPIRAIRAALEIHSAVEAFSPRFEWAIGCPLTMHTGINTGLVVTGEVDVEKGIHGLTGDAINLASRLERIAGAGEIIIGPDTYSQSFNYFEFETLGPAKFKGRKALVRIYKVISIKKEIFKIHRLQGLRANLVGRAEEMGILANSVTRLKEGQGSVITICGDAGTGKSRLKREFKDSLDLIEIQWCEGHSYGYTRNVAYYPLINLLTHAFQIEENYRPEQVRAKVEAGVGYLMGEGSRVTPYIGSLFALHYPEIEEVSPEFWKNKLHESIQIILTALIDKAPTIVSFEDLHWADPSFIELLHRLLKNVSGSAVFICTYRPSFSLFNNEPPAGINKRYYDIRLKDLEVLDANEMLSSMLNSRCIPVEVYDVVRQKAEGNPFFIEEIINSLIESDVLLRENNSWKLMRKITEADIPATIQGVLTARIDRLEQKSKNILQEASVIGRTFLYKILKKISDSDTDLMHYLSGLEKLDLISSQSMTSELEYIFKHALTQEVVYSGLLIKERQIIHDRIALVMERLFEDRLHEFYETLAFHFEQGRSIAKAVEYIVKSGEKSLSKYAVREAHQYFRKAYDILLSKGELTEPEIIILIDILNSWAYVFFYLGEIKEFVHIFESHLILVESNIDDKAKVGMFFVWLGVAVFLAGKPKVSYEYLSKGLELGKNAGNQKVVGYACSWFTWSCAELGLFAEGISFAERARKIVNSFPSEQFLFFSGTAGLCYINFFKGDTISVLEGASRLIDHGEINENSRSKAFGHWMKAFGHWCSGDLKKSQKCCQKAVDVAMDPATSKFPLATLGFAFLKSGQLQKAENILKFGLDFCEQRGMGELTILFQYFLAPTLIAKGHMQQGMNLLKKSRKEMLSHHRRTQYAISEFILGEVYSQIAIGQRPPFWIMAKNIGFLIKTVPFAFKKSEKHYNKAVELLKKIGVKGFLGPVYLNMGLLYISKKKKNQARQCILEAIDIFKQCGAEVYLKQANDTLTSLN